MVSVQHQLLTLAILALLTLASCSPKARRRQDDLELRTPAHHHAIIWKKLLPILQVAFTNAVTSTLVNWFYPWRIVPYPPGKIGIAQLWGGYPKHHYYGRRRRSLHNSSGKAS